MNIEEAKMQNYKIKVVNEAESKEAQELFFELGCYWYNLGKEVNYLKNKFLFVNGIKQISRHNDDDIFFQSDNQEITLPQLRDLVEEKNGLAVNSGYKISGLFSDLDQPKQMTWQDALRAVADGKEVEYYAYGGRNCWCSVKGQNLYFLIDERMEFRLAPQRKELNGNFTKEELLKIAGEMG